MRRPQGRSRYLVAGGGSAGEDHGVDVTVEVWDEMPHVGHAFAGLLPEADQAIERIGAWLTERIPAS